MGVSPSIPSAVTMMECGRPSGPAPVLPSVSSVFMPPVREDAIFCSCAFNFSTGSFPPFNLLQASATSSI